MAKKMYIGDTASKARKIKKGYIGDTSSKARKLKKGYIGVGGVARPFFNGGELGYYGAITPLSAAAHSIAGASVGDFALFTGATLPSTDVYNTELVKTTVEGLTLSGKYHVEGISVGTRAIFAGGSYTTTVSTPNGSQTVSPISNHVEAYDEDLVKSVLDTMTARLHFGAACTGRYMVLAGGTTSNGTGDDATPTTKAEAYDIDTFVKSTVTALTSKRYWLRGAHVGKYALLGGGSPSLQSRYEAYDEDLVKTIAPDGVNWGSNTDKYAAASVGDYAVFAGGSDAGGNQTRFNLASVYDSELVTTTILLLRGQTCASYLSAATLGNVAMFAGGYDIIEEPTTHQVRRDDVDVCDENLMTNIMSQLSVGRSHMASAVVGDFALFAGGYVDTSTETTATEVSDIVDAYTMEGSTIDIETDIPLPDTGLINMNYDSSSTTNSLSSHSYRLPKCKIVFTGYRTQLTSGTYGESTVYALNLNTGETIRIFTQLMGAYDGVEYDTDYSLSDIGSIEAEIEEGDWKIGISSSGDADAVVTVSSYFHFEAI